MKMTRWRWLPVVAYIALIAMPAFAADETDRLRDLAKRSKTDGRLDQVAVYLCQAAGINEKNNGKQCERARASATAKLQEFEGDFGTGKFELGQKDYAGSIRDLKKVLYGPHLEEAAHLVEQAKTLQMKSASDPTGMVSLRAAQAAYDRGSFDAATTAANKVESANLKPIAAQILNNIKIYQATISEAESLERSGNFKEAKAKYSFALTIKSNGPGDPAGAVQRVAALLAQQKLDTAKAQAAKLQPTAKPDPLLLKNALAKADRDEKQRNWKAALDDYETVLSLDSAQPEALRGKRRALAQLRKSSGSQSDSTNVVSMSASMSSESATPQDLLRAQLENGIHAYYASQFSEANQDLSQYLNAGGESYKGAAHFYLAACLLSQALLADPQDASHVQGLQHDAQEHFRLASEEKYKPIEKLVSPRIFAEWKRMEKQQ